MAHPIPNRIRLIRRQELNGVLATRKPARGDLLYLQASGSAERRAGTAHGTLAVDGTHGRGEMRQSSQLVDQKHTVEATGLLVESDVVDAALATAKHAGH